MKRIHRISPTILQSVIYVFSLALFKLFADIKYEGVENVLKYQEENPGKPLIFAANHSSEWDGPLVRVGMPFFWKGSPMYYVSMRKEFYTDSGWRKLIYGGTLFNLLGAYPVYSGRHDYKYSLQNFFNILNRGRNICIFPEGQRTKTGEIGKAHGGVAFLSHTLGVAVVPVAIKGLALFKVNEFFAGKRSVVIRYGKPMLPSDLITHETPEIEEYKAGAAKVMAEVERMVKN